MPKKVQMLVAGVVPYWCKKLSASQQYKINLYLVCLENENITVLLGYIWEM